ncbi:MAG: tyrosine protein kinase, partial [Mycobacterium sp.]|nr:tyrosine protein kinase [Mycobacterium sp.]
AQPESQFLSISLSGADVSALIALPRLGEEATPDPAPSVVGGRLLLTDGSVVALSGGLLLGREPQNAPEVADGSLSALALPDADRAVSRVHARICVDDAGVTIEDLGSANGTALAAPETSEWVALRPGEPLTLLPGARIRIGEQELTFVVDPSPAPPPPPVAPPEAPPAAATFPLDRPAEQHDGIGDYEFVRPLGSGERGAYFLAIPPARLQLDAQFVAVKVFRGATSDDAFRRATRELRAFAAAQSQYLVKVHDAGQDSGQLFYSMDYISGGSLAEPVTPLDEAGIIKSVAQAARAAHALHEVGVVHQAIMPKNILLGDTKAYLADLGLAQLISQESFSTSLGDFEGLEFLDPSILTGARGTRATDVWSLAATLHRALTGSAIYEGLSADPLLAIRAVLTQQVAVSESLSPELAAVIRACLDPDLSLRPATALELAKQLESLIPV